MSSSDSDDGVPLSAMVSNGGRLQALEKEGRRANGGSRIADNGDYSGSDSDSVPLSVLSNRIVGTVVNNSNNNNNNVENGSDSESDLPLSGAVRNGAAGSKRVKRELPPAAAPKAAKKFKSEQQPKATKATKATAAPRRVKREPKSGNGSASGSSRKSSRENTPLAKQLVDRKPLIKAESSMTPASSSQEASDNEEYKWWLDTKGNDGPKWQTLEHNGVMFPPDYQPHGLPLIYNGQEIKMHPEVEEVATFFAGLLGSDHAVNKTFQTNFFRDFKDLCDKHMGKHPIKVFSQCDFSVINNHLEGQKVQRKAKTKAEKEADKQEKQKAEEQYGFCVLDGRREKVGNFRIEPPSLFRGRGAHPKTGTVKLRVQPEQVTINIGKEANIPDPPPGHKWGKVIHDNTVTWLATWKENVNNNTKYVFLAAGSSLKGQSDMRKFDKARKLVHHIDSIRAQYTRELKSELMAERQRATAIYLIDRYALRAGNEKGEDEADTFGCCSLLCEHVKLEQPNIVHFDFLGKDSIRYQKTTEVEKQVWKNLRLFQRAPKTGSDMLFDRLVTSSLNSFLQSLMLGLTAKVFRTFNASFVFQKQLANTPKDGTEAEKILAYNRANREVAVLCNHQRSVSKSFQGQMDRIEDRLLAVRYQRMLLKEHLLATDPKLKGSRPDLAKKEPGVTADWIKQYLITTCEVDREKARKKFDRENEKLKEAGEPLVPESTLKERLDDIDEREKSINDGSYDPELPIGKGASSEKVLEKLDKLAERVANIEVDKIERDENKSTALSTSKINYIDPRISVAWCRKYNVPLEKIFNKTLREKFTWAMEVDERWKF